MRFIGAREARRVTGVTCYRRQVFIRSTSSFARLPYKIIILFIRHQYILIASKTPRCIQRITGCTLCTTNDIEKV